MRGDRPECMWCYPGGAEMTVNACRLSRVQIQERSSYLSCREDQRIVHIFLAGLLSLWFQMKVIGFPDREPGRWCMASLPSTWTSYGRRSFHWRSTPTPCWWNWNRVNWMQTMGSSMIHEHRKRFLRVNCIVSIGSTRLLCLKDFSCCRNEGSRERHRKLLHSLDIFSLNSFLCCTTTRTTGTSACRKNDVLSMNNPGWSQNCMGTSRYFCFNSSMAFAMHSMEGTCSTCFQKWPDQFPRGG